MAATIFAAHTAIHCWSCWWWPRPSGRSAPPSWCRGSPTRWPADTTSTWCPTTRWRFTALLLLTSIIIAGALAAFLVLDEIDAGTLTALRVTPVPLSTFFAYRACTVVVVTTIYVVTTMSFSGILRPGLVPALIPIGMVAGLSAVVTLLLIVAVASNKIQGIAMVRVLGILIAGLPCLPWFVDSAWNLAFGVLPPYWAAKAFWVANDHGTWWPYLLGGIVYNLAVAWPLFRRFVAKNT